MCFFYYICVFAAGELSTTDTTILQAIRTMFVWLVNLVLYSIPTGQSHHFGEQWTRWSLMQAGGFVVLLCSTFVFSRGDNERLRSQMEYEAAIIMLDQPPPWSPPSVAGSMYSGSRGRFTATMDIDTASIIRGATRSPYTTPEATPHRRSITIRNPESDPGDLDGKS